MDAIIKPLDEPNDNYKSRDVIFNWEEGEGIGQPRLKRYQHDQRPVDNDCLFGGKTLVVSSPLGSQKKR